MIELSADAYLWVKALHVVAIIAWMAALLYLPRLFVYHSQVKPGTEASETFKVMERRLEKAIMTPAMVASWVFGLILVAAYGDLTAGWLHAKITFVVGLTAVHVLLMRWRGAFAADRNRRTTKFYRVINEVPTVLMIGIVIFVIVKPF